MLKKTLIIFGLIFLFFLAPLVVKAADCVYEPEVIIVDVNTEFSYKCTSFEKNIEYKAEVINPLSRYQKFSSIKTDNNGYVIFTFTTPPKGNYTINIYKTGQIMPVVISNFSVTDVVPTAKPSAIPVPTITCDNGQGVNTALGCVKTDPEQFVGWFLGLAISIGGGIAFLLILWGAFQIITSSGVPEKLNSGREIIVSAISGLLMIIFSILILELIGVDILQIPGFGK